MWSNPLHQIHASSCSSRLTLLRGKGLHASDSAVAQTLKVNPHIAFGTSYLHRGIVPRKGDPLILRQFAAYRDVMGAMDTPRYSAPFRAAVFELLTTALKDTAICWTGHSFQSPDWMMSDIAIRALAKWRPDQFTLPGARDTFLDRENARQLFWKLAHQGTGSSPVALENLLARTADGKPKANAPNRVLKVVTRAPKHSTASWIGLVNSLEGTELTAEKIESIMLSFMIDERTAKNSLGILVICHGNRQGVTVIAESTNDLDQPRHRWKPTLDNLIEHGRAQLLDDSTFLGEPKDWAAGFARSRKIFTAALLNHTKEECRIRRLIIR